MKASSDEAVCGSVGCGSFSEAENRAVLSAAEEAVRNINAYVLLGKETKVFVIIPIYDNISRSSFVY